MKFLYLREVELHICGRKSGYSIYVQGKFIIHMKNNIRLFHKNEID